MFDIKKMDASCLEIYRRPGWMQLWAAWSSAKHLWPWQVD